ncbi:hypothetical protein DH2020_049970 [Rehmannia glutinosa]|uniref:Uncharacterized protein n=1 Tax=Rehmannia glutinosa TaxID=99300 RepID=A0ABR0U1U3_REHGL
MRRSTASETPCTAASALFRSSNTSSSKSSTIWIRPKGIGHLYWSFRYAADTEPPGVHAGATYELRTIGLSDDALQRAANDGVPHGAQLMIREPQQQQQQQQQFLEAQQLAAVAAAAAREQEMLRSYEQQQQQQQQNDLGRFNSGFDEAVGPVTATGFNQMPAGAAGASMQPSLALGSSYETVPYHHHIQQHGNVPEHSHQLQPQQELLLQQQVVTAHHQQQQLVQPQGSHTQQQQPRAKSEEGRSVGPSC